MALADKLRAEIDSGRCLRYAVSRSTVGNVSTDNAKANQSISTAMDAINQMVPDDGALAVEAKPDFPFSVENVQAFVTFLKHCGGFEIC